MALRTIAAEWTRIGITGFGGPPTHIALLRRLVVDRRGWISADELEGAIAACNLLPGPASTQLAIFCARRLGGVRGAVVGGLGFVLPAVVAVTALSALFLSRSPPLWIRGAGAGAGAAVAAVAVRAGVDLLLPSWRRSVERPAYRPRWLAFAGTGAAAGALLGPYLVLVLIGCGLIEVSAGTRSHADVRKLAGILPFPVAATVGGLSPLAWVAFKVGALSYGGGFVIVPLMQRDAVHTYHWLSATQFLGAVALGQVTPGPVVATVAAVGYAAHRLAGAALAAVIAFLPSFLIVLAGAPHFARLRQDRRMQSFLDGAGPAATGAILGSAVPLAGALRESWQAVLLGAAAAMLLVLRRGVVPVLLVAGALGAGIAAAGGPVP